MPLSYPYPPLADGVVALRPWTPADIPDIVRCCNDSEIRRWLPAIPIPYTRDDAVTFLDDADGLLERDMMRLAIADASTLAPRGSVGLRILSPGVAQTGYWVDPLARGQGIASRALTLAAAHALRTFPIQRLQLFTGVENVASQRVAERAGFTREGTLRNWYHLRGEPQDAIMYSRLPGDAA
ncbi:MAG TPA: GNAT family protein [Gaiellales bacterium]|jgi:RimJ/RimL family protein N-acetyltransferase